MHGRALSPSPIALFLLGLAERGADGAVEVGGRRVLLAGGRVVDVLPADEDGGLVDYLRESGRVPQAALQRCVSRARDESAPVERVLLSSQVISESALDDVRRRLWLDRLVRAMALASEQGREPTAVQPHSEDPTGRGAPLVPLVLDALERRAAEEDAGLVGARADHRLEWLDTPHEAAGRRWARFGGDEPFIGISEILKQTPAGASRVAALVRAGVARLASATAPPPPDRRSSRIPPPRSGEGIPPELSGFERTSLPPARTPAMQLDPGESVVFDEEPEMGPSLPELPSPSEDLEDELDEIERAVASLEEAEASGPARAAAWKRFGRAWESRYGSLTEAARAFREAAAADETDDEALQLASDRCASLGQTELAVAYAGAAVALHPAGPKRAQALLRYALLERRLGEHAEALGAARAATEAAPALADPRELAVELWCELGRPVDAAKTAGSAAAHILDADPTRALRFAALAHALDPTNADHTEAYAKCLEHNGLTEASVAIRADVARRTPDAEARRTLLLAAAERAEVADRPALAAVLLTRAFDREPGLDVLYDPLDQDLAQAGATLERAVILEEMAATAPEDARAHWLRRAAEARLDLPTDGSWEAELRARALELDPEHEQNLQAIRELAVARDDVRLRADAIERALLRGRWSSTSAQAPMLEELARLAEDELDAPMRAAWAWQRLAAIDPDAPAPARQLERLRARVDEHEERREELERGVRAEADGHRVESVRALADHLRDDPEHRRKAISLYREVLEAVPDAAQVADALERLLRLDGDSYHEAAALKMRADAADKRGDRVRLLNRLASLQVMRRDLREAATASQRVLAELPTHREASIRLRRMACRLRDRELLREALSSEAQIPLAPAARGQVLIALALELERVGSIDEAISCAEEALAADPRSAEAALLVARHLPDVDDPRAALKVVRGIFGDSPPMLAAWASAARDAGEHALMTEALDVWSEVSRFDAEPWMMSLDALPAHGTDAALVGAIEGAIRPERVSPAMEDPLLSAIERLGERDPAVAGRLAVRAGDALGENGDTLRAMAARLAEATGLYALQRDVLERDLATAVDDDDVLETLRALATLHREGGDRAAEARTYLRILGVRSDDPDALAQLAGIYASTGQTERLLAALSLRLGSAEDRTSILLEIATVHARMRGDIDAAEAFLRKAWSPDDGAVQPLLRAATALAELSRPQRAVTMLREAGRDLGRRDAAKVYRHAVHLAWRAAQDRRLALTVATEGLERAPGSGPLLVQFEQLALEIGDIEIAEQTYARLIERAMGPHGRRALGYRRARWLERAGAPQRALRAYIEAFERNPQAGVIYTSIERLAREQGNIVALANAAMVLAERATHPAVRIRMAKEAASIFESELAAPERAFDILVTMWEASGDSEIEERLSRLAGQLLESDRDKGEAAFERVLSVLRKHAADAWMGEARARLVLRQARLHAIGRGDLEDAEETVEEALDAAREDGGGDPDLLADLHTELATWLLEANERERAAERVAAALEAKATHSRAVQLAGTLGVPIPEAPEQAASGGEAAGSDPFSDWGELTDESEDDGDDDEEEASDDGDESEDDREVASDDDDESEDDGDDEEEEASDDDDELEDDDGSEDVDEGATDDDAGLEDDDGSEDDDEEEASDGAGEPDDTIEMAAAPRGAEFEGRPSFARWAPAAPPGTKAPSQPPADLPWMSPSSPPEGPDEMVRKARELVARGGGKALTQATSLLCGALALEPHRVDAARDLIELEPRVSSPRTFHFARGIASLLDPDLANPEPLPPALPSELNDWLRDPAFAANRELWRVLWEHARPLFRERAAIPLQPNDRVLRIATNAVSRAFVRALDALRITDLPVFYHSQTAAPGLRIFRTSPPTLYAAGEFAPGVDAMAFELGRVLELSRADHLLVATLEHDRATTVVEAVQAAFGPAESGGDIARAAASLAGELWDTIPARSQGDVRELLVTTERFGDIEGTRDAATHAADRAGLFACGDLGVAVRAVAEVPITDEASLKAALGEGRAAALARFAFSRLTER